MSARAAVAFLSTSAALIACTAQNDAIDGLRVVTTDSAGIAIVEISGDVSSLPEWSLAAEPVVVIGDRPPLLGRVGEVVLLSDGRVLVEDEQAAELHLFDASGTALRLVGGRGDGPGEFQNLTELSVAPGDTAYAYDRRLYRISSFDPDGNLIRTLGVERERAGPASLVLDAWAVDSERLVLHSLGPRLAVPTGGEAYRDQRDAVLHSLAADGAERRPAVHFTGGYSIAGSHGDAGSSFANRPFVDVSAGRVLTGSGLTYEVVIRNADLDPMRIVRWGGWERPLTEEIVSAVRDTLEAGMAAFRAANPEVAALLLDALFRADLLPALLPEVGAAMQDEEGRIWVARFQLSTGMWNEQDIWHVLDPEGAPLARVRLPANARLAFVRNDRVALIVRDSLDVEQVRVFRLERGR